MNEIREIYIYESLKESFVVQNILKNHSSSSAIHWYNDEKSLKQNLSLRGEPFLKETLVVSEYKGEFLSRCPGTDGMVCCNYFVINTGPGCVYDCHYCFLQSFMNVPYMSVYGNLGDMFFELDHKLAGKKGHYRVGTGEYSDSLAIDTLTGISPMLVERFSSYDNLTLELKTKSDTINSLKGLSHGGNTVVAWSLNPDSVIQSIEEKTASLEGRLQAAKEVAAWGYRIAFHLDPVIFIENWKEEYGAMLDRVGEVMKHTPIDWISLGAFRYSPALRDVVQYRFPEDRLTGAEMIQGEDKKYRYFKTIRRELFQFLTDKIERVAPGTFHYMCMETKSMWEQVYGHAPENPRILEARFDQKKNHESF